MKTKWGVIGSAGIAKRRTIPEGVMQADNAELAAVYDINREANAEVAEQFRVCAYDSDADLLASDVDCVYIATPTNCHCEQVLKAAAAGKHVLCEKPLGMTVAECDRMITACEAAGVKLGVGFMMRYQAQFQAAARLVRDGRLGKPIYGRAQLSCWYPPIPGAWRQHPDQGGGGSLMDLGGHCIDLLEMFLGRATSVQCVTDRLVHDYSSEDTAIVLLEFESGAKGTVDCLFNTPDSASPNRLEIYGSLGSILSEGAIGQGESGVMSARIEADAGAYAAQQERSADGGMLVNPPPVNMYRAEIEAFARAVLENNDPPIGGAAGRWSQTVLTACYESARRGARIKIDAQA